MVLSLNILVNCLRRTGTACRRAYSGTRTTMPQQYKSKALAINAVAMQWQSLHLDSLASGGCNHLNDTEECYRTMVLHRPIWSTSIVIPSASSLRLRSIFIRSQSSRCVKSSLSVDMKQREQKRLCVEDKKGSW